jgi:hypothetical protein
LWYLCNTFSYTNRHSYSYANGNRRRRNTVTESDLRTRLVGRS